MPPRLSFDPGPASVRGFSLIELVIVIVILGVIAAVAIPRVSRGADNAGEAALRSNLATLRRGIELFRAESPTSSYPGIGIAMDLQPYVHAVPLLTVPTASGGVPRATINPFGASARNYATVSPGQPQDSWMYCDENGDLWANEPAYGSW